MKAAAARRAAGSDRRRRRPHRHRRLTLTRRAGPRATAVSSGAGLHADLPTQDAAEGVVLAPGGDQVAGGLVRLDERALAALAERLGEHRHVHRLHGRRPAGLPGEQPAERLQRVQQAQLQRARGRSGPSRRTSRAAAPGRRSARDRRPGRRGPARTGQHPGGPGLQRAGQVDARRPRAGPAIDCSATTRGQPTCCSRHSADRRLPAARPSSTVGPQHPGGRPPVDRAGCSARYASRRRLPGGTATGTASKVSERPPSTRRTLPSGGLWTTPSRCLSDSSGAAPGLPSACIPCIPCLPRWEWFPPGDDRSAL